MPASDCSPRVILDGAERRIDAALLGDLPLPAYRADASKVERGKLLVVGGSAHTAGAALLSARAALRIGCGTVRLSVPAELVGAFSASHPELMVVPLPTSDAEADDLIDLLASCQAALFGPGLAEDDAAVRLTERFLSACAVPAVVDAGGLHSWRALCDGGIDPARLRAGPRIFTPHSGEMSALVGCSLAELRARPVELGQEFVARYGITLVLKGHHTLVVAHDEPVYRNTVGTRALGTAGSGDVLAGTIAGLLAQDLTPAAAAVWGVYSHARAGSDAAAALGEDGVLASDVIDRLPIVLRRLRAMMPARGRPARRRARLRRLARPDQGSD